jgi:hypothetical protein
VRQTSTGRKPLTQRYGAFRKGKGMKVRILGVPTIAPAWVGKIGEIREPSSDFYKGKCYTVAVEGQELALYENEFEMIDEEE